MAINSHVLLLCLSSIVLWRSALCGYIPFYSSNYATGSNETGRAQVFPDFSGPTSSSCGSLNTDSHFLSELNFDAVNDRVLVGAADNLYLLNKDLTCVSSYSWTTAQQSLSSCLAGNTRSDQNSICRNHIRTYKKLPSDSNRIFVCGTQAGETPQCRTVTIGGNAFGTDTPAVTASDGLISHYPEFSGFGEFRDSGSSDTTFFAAGFYQGNKGVGRNYNISYHTVDYTSATSTLTLREDYSTKDSDYWLKDPVTFVDYYRADYLRPGGQTHDYQFYFVFLRESLVGVSGYDVIYSRVVRICRNDPGVNGQFSTFMKARIYCEREVPPGREFNSAIDYQYNEMQSMVFNDQGRFRENGEWVKMMYGAFSGSTIGPQGTAICAYRADNSLVTGGQAMGYNRGIFDIFRDDLVNRNPMPGEAMEEENMFVECNPSGRSANDSEKVMIVQDVIQIGQDPLVVFDGFIVTQMAVDQVCVVNYNPTQQCHNQDVLFLGTDNGKIMKVVFGLQGGTELTPIVAEEITLDDQSEDNQVHELRIEVDSGSNEKFIYATTQSKVFRIPLQRCSRFNGKGCQKCLGSQDPYCVWNTTSGMCEANNLMAANSGVGNVPENIWQNVSSGAVSECQASPVCDLTATAIDHESVMCMVQCNNTMYASFDIRSFNGDSPLSAARMCDNPTANPSLNQSLDNSGEACIQFTGGRGLHSYECTVSLNNGLTFAASTKTPPGPPLQIAPSDVQTEVTQTSFRVCVVVDILTDDFNNYRLEVTYGSNTQVQNFTSGTCIWIRQQEPGSTVSYSVVVGNDVATSNSVPGTLQLLADVPGRCQNFMSTTTNVSASLSWSPPTDTNGDITGYSVSVDGSEIIGCVSQATTSYTVTGLRPFTSYEFGVRACTSAGAGEVSTLNGMTLCGSPGEVRNLQLTPGSTSIQAMWEVPTAVNGDPAMIRYQLDSVCDGVTTGTSLLPSTGHTTSGLLPLTTCCVQVAAINTCNGMTYTGLASEMCADTTDMQPGTVENLATTDISSTSLFVEWDPPANYQRPGLTYRVTVGQQNTPRNTDTPHLFIDQLSPNTQYTISVETFSTTGLLSSTSGSTTATTSPAVPPPPENVRLSFASNTLNIDWEDPNRAAFTITQYRVVWRCNEDNGEATVTDLSHSVGNMQLDFSWCTAQVRSINSVGSSVFSQLGSVVVPVAVPEQPVCYFVSDNGGTVSINFAVTDPFSVKDLRYDWNLYGNVNVNGSDTFTNNTVQVPVARNTNYSFELRLCNTEGCSGYSDLLVFFTGLNPPSPPAVVTPQATGSNSANISWALPPRETEGSLNYSVQIAGPCQSQSITVEPNESRSNRWDVVTGLCAGVTYTVVVQSIESTFNIPGAYSRAFTLTTPPGVPSVPRSIVVQYFATTNDLAISWATPDIPNGDIVRYEVLWAAYASTPKCNEPEDTAISANTTSRRYNAVNPENIKLGVVKDVMVCVRAYTSTDVGQWGQATITLNDFILPTAAPLTDSEGDCNGLIIVAGIAGFAVLSSIFMGIVLAVVIGKNGWTLCSKDKKKVEDLKHPPYTNRTDSMKPLVINGTA